MSTVNRVVHPTPLRLLRTEERPLSCALNTTISIANYAQEEVVSLEVRSPEECLPYLTADSITWISVSGLGREDILQKLGEVLNLPSLLLEEVVNVPQRPKFEAYEQQDLLICRMVKPDADGKGFSRQQLSIVLGQNYVLTIAEEARDYGFEALRDRLQRNKSLIRSLGSDYLTYYILDVIINSFFPILEDYGERLEHIESQVVSSPNSKTLENIYQVKRELLMLRRSIWPQRDAISVFIRENSTLVRDEVKLYLQDCCDRSVQIIDLVETYRELASSMMDVYLSATSNRMNEHMRFLTVLSTIFLPLTFIAGVYGMNFENIPELEWDWGYPFVLVLMLVVASSLLIYFRRKGWLFPVSLTEKDSDRSSRLETTPHISDSYPPTGQS